METHSCKATPLTSPNSSSNGAPFMIRRNYSGRSMYRLHRKLVINSSAAHCVATTHDA